MEYYKTSDVKIILGDSFDEMKKMKSNSVDMIFADPPYFLSGDGITCSNGRMVSVNKGIWDEKLTLKEKHKFNKKWLRMCKRLLKDDGTIWISGTYHNIYSIGIALEELGYRIINNITWVKPNAAPNLGCRCFTHSTETILWAKKDLKKAKHYFDYTLMKSLNNNKQMRDVWEIATTPKREKIFGKHPTQKPEKLLEQIILSSTKEGDLIFDPFAGSSTTGVVAMKNKRKYIGIELEKEYVELSKRRLENEPR
jgi:DNA modification methylase